MGSEKLCRSSVERRRMRTKNREFDPIGRIRTSKEATDNVKAAYRCRRQGWRRRCEKNRQTGKRSKRLGQRLPGWPPNTTMHSHATWERRREATEKKRCWLQQFHAETMLQGGLKANGGIVLREQRIRQFWIRAHYGWEHVRGHNRQA